MRKSINKENSKWILLFLFMFLSLGMQAQWDEYGGGSDECYITDAMKAGPYVDGVNAYGVHKEYTGNTGEIRWEEDPNDPNFISPVFVIIPQYAYSCSTSGSNDTGGVFTYGGVQAGGGSGGVPSGGGSGGAGVSSTPPPEECGVLVCSGPLIDKPYLVPNTTTCKCDKLPRPWYQDYDGDGWHSNFVVRIDPPDQYFKKTTLGEDCNDYNKLVTSDCYRYWYRDNDGDKYDGGTDYSEEEPSSPGNWFEGKSLGIDCDDTKPNIYKLNKCGKCEVEPTSGTCSEDCDTSVEDLKQIFPNTSDSKLKAIADALNKYGAKLGINTKEKLQHFLAQAAVESHNLNAFKEYTNYRPARAMEVFKGKFNPIGSDNQDLTKKNLSDFYTSGNTFLNAESFYNWVYADKNRSVKSRLGNIEVGDGWVFRGRGIIQLTGRENYTKFSDWYKQNINSNIDIENSPNLLETNIEIGTISGLYFFKTKVLDKMAVNGNTDISRITLIVNSKQEGLKERKKYLIEAKNKINCK